MCLRDWRISESWSGRILESLTDAMMRSAFFLAEPLTGLRHFPSSNPSSLVNCAMIPRAVTPIGSERTEARPMFEIVMQSW